MRWEISGTMSRRSLDVAFDVIGDIVLSAASQQYGGFTVPSADLILDEIRRDLFCQVCGKSIQVLDFPKEKRRSNRYGRCRT